MNWFNVLKRRRISDPRKGRKGLSPEQQKKYGFKTATKTKEQREAELARVREEDRRDKEAQIPAMLNAIEDAIYSSHSNKIMKVIDRVANWFEKYLESYYGLSEEEFYEKEMEDWHRGEWGKGDDIDTVEEAEKEAKTQKKMYAYQKKFVKDNVNKLQALDVNEVVAAMVGLLTNKEYRYAKAYQQLLEEDKAEFDERINRMLEPFYKFQRLGQLGITGVLGALDITLLDPAGHSYYEIMIEDMRG